MNPVKLATQLIKEKLPDVEIHTTNFPGGGNHEHVGLMVISDAFEGKSLLQQHRMIMDILREALREQIHAVQLKTMTKKEFQEKYQD